MPLITSAAAVSNEATALGAAETPTAEVSAAQLRKMQISEFSAWVRTQTNEVFSATFS
jgi:hypothetical protein